VAIKDESGKDLASARQKGGAGVLFGFKNGGKGSYTLSAGTDELAIEVGASTTISRGSTVIGKVVPSDGACRFEDGGGTTLAVVRPHTGVKGDDPWTHPLLSPQGGELGTLKLMRSHTTWSDIAQEIWLWDKAGSLKAPSSGVLISLNAPVSEVLGDVLVAACVDFSVLPRGYVS